MTTDDSALIAAAAGGGRLTITVDRADKANAITRAMLTRLSELLEEAAADTELRVLVLTGAGTRCFSAGADRDEFAEHTAHAVTAHDFDRAWDEVSGQLAKFPALTIARLNGHCAGRGLSLGLACDLRVASAAAELFFPALANRVLPGADDVERLTALVGPSRCKALLMTGVRLSSELALVWRLVDEVVTAAELDQAVDRMCAPALAAAAHEVLAIKRMCGPRLDYAMVDLCYRAMYDGDKASRRRLREG